MQKFDPNPFELQSHLDWQYEQKSSRFSLCAASKVEFENWRVSFKKEISKITGIAGRERRESEIEILQTVDARHYTKQLAAMKVGKDEIIPVYLLVPKREPPFQSILVFHGHDPSAEYCMGEVPDAKTRDQNLGLNNNYAHVLAEAGYLVCVVEQRGLGNRVTHQISNETQRSCRHLAFSYLMLGKTLLGERILDGMSVLSYLTSRPDVTGHPGCTGHSAGGTTALWLAALDERISVVVVSGYFCSFKESILEMNHCECNYVPGMLTLGEMGDLAALIAPRPFRIIHGEQDLIFPVQFARSEFETVARAYQINERQDAADLFIHSEGHMYHNRAACEWFDKWLV